MRTIQVIFQLTPVRIALAALFGLLATRMVARETLSSPRTGEACSDETGAATSGKAASDTAGAFAGTECLSISIDEAKQDNSIKTDLVVAEYSSLRDEIMKRIERAR